MKLKVLKKREQVEAGICEFFHTMDFQKVRTPIMVPCPGMEIHIRPFQVLPFAQSPDDQARSPAFLHTSPEFAMKRLLVSGMEKIFQICPAFRDEPESTTHLPEFTLLEWYRAHSGYEAIMRDTEELFDFLAQKLFGKCPSRSCEISTSRRPG